MAYTLEQFCADSHAALKADPGPDGQEKVRRYLETLLANKDFIAATFPPGEETPQRTLYQDPDLGFLVLAHINKGNRKSPPHDHGASWAVYGVAKAHTDMTVWRRRDERTGPGDAEIGIDHQYRLDVGQAGNFSAHVIHSTRHDEPSCLIRVTGTDLDSIPRLRFDLEKKKAIAMGVSAQAAQ